MPQLVNEHDVFVLEPNTCAENKNLNEHDAFILEPNTCAKNKNLLPIAAKKDELKLLYSLDMKASRPLELVSAIDDNATLP
jgi:hypothetical protein